MVLQDGFGEFVIREGMEEMKFCSIHKKECASLVDMRMLFLREDGKDVSEEQFCKIEENLPSYFEKHIDKDCFAFGAYDHERIVSVALLLTMEKPSNLRFMTGRIGEVLNVYTIPEYRRQGIATRVMQMLLDFAKEKNLDFVELKATKNGYPLYKKLCFVESPATYISMKHMLE